MAIDERGPSLREYVEVRFNLLQENIANQEVGLTGLIDKQAKRYDEMLNERDTRYQQRFEATAIYVAFGFSSAEKAITKAEIATEKRFEGVNEFRSQLGDQQRTFMPRAEVLVMESAVTNRLAAVEKRVDTLLAERAGIRGGWGYAVGVVGFVLTVVSLVMMFARVKGG